MQYFKTQDPTNKLQSTASQEAEGGLEASLENNSREVGKKRGAAIL